jgi:hypothetical protein
MARTLQSKALRRTVESTARRSIAVAARSTSAANVVEYSCMSKRSVSMRTSGRISGQGFRSSRVACLPRLAHATREDRIRHAAAERIKLPRHRDAEPLFRRWDVILVVEPDIDLCEPDLAVLLLASCTSDLRSVVGPRDVTQIAGCRGSADTSNARASPLLVGNA